ncbi:hypothetical protein D3C72_1273110 [compost metagenome]
MIELINHQSTYLTVLLQKTNFAKWPQGLKWGLEALVVVGVVVSLLTVAPWEKIAKLNFSTGSKEVILAEVDKPQNSEPEKADVPEFVDEGIKTAKNAGTPAASPAPAASAVIEKAPVAKAPVHEIPPPPAAPPAKIADKKEPKEIAENGATANATGGGFLYRGEIDITGIQTVGPKIIDKIKELGGRKAGDVELGWQKTPHSMYFHFTLPEAKYPELEAFLATYGKARISKLKHPRVMPDGIIRLILTVDETSP